MAPEIRSVRVDGHTTLVDVKVPLHRLNVLVGANGAGKSNFINALELLGRIADDDLQLYVSLSGGAARLLHQGSQPAESMLLTLEAPPLVYVAELGATADDQLVFLDERVLGEPTPGGGHGRINRGGERETSLHAYLRRLDEDEARSPARADVEAVLAAIKGCRVFHFHDTSARAPVKGRQPTADNLSLRPRAENLAPVLMALRGDHPAAYRRIVRTVGLVAPFLRDFVLEPEGKDTVRLRWRATDSDTVFSADQLSDGTLRYICLATLLLHPVRPRLIVLDEPELGLHPYAIAQLADMLHAASVECEVVVATQSVTLLDHMYLEDVVVVELDKGVSVFHRPERSRLEAWLNDYSLGDLWLKNLIGGRPSPSSGARF